MPVKLEKLKEWKKQDEKIWEPIFTKFRERLAASYGVEDAQWDPEVLSNRKKVDRPCQQYNIYPGFIRPSVNALKECPPEAEFYPISEATEEDAKVVAGRLRTIQEESNATQAYLQAMELSMRGGLGCWTIIPRKVRGKIQIMIEGRDDPTTILIDSSAKSFNYADIKRAFIRDEMTEDDYREQYPNGGASAVDGIVTVWQAYIQVTKKVNGADGVEEEVTRVEHYVFDETSPEILHFSDKFPCSRIPVVYITAPRAIIGDEVQVFPITHDIEPMQREINWLKSEAIASISSAPKALWKAAKNAVKNFLGSWTDSATSPDSVLLYEGDRAPEQIDAPQAPEGYMKLADSNLEMARVVTGIYPDPTLQSKVDAPSGKAIKMQRMGSGVANYHYTDTIHYGIKLTAEIVAEQMEHFHNDNEIRIAKSNDGKIQKVSFGDTDVEGAHNLNLATARFGVTISVGPSYASQREELMDKVMEMVGNDPQTRAVMMPWIMGQLPIPGVEDIVEILEATLPPEIQQILASKKSGDPKQQNQALRLQLQQMATQLQQFKKMVPALTEELQHTSELYKNLKEDRSQERQTKIELADKQHEAALQGKAMEIHGRHVEGIEQTQRDEHLQRMEAEANERLEMLRGDIEKEIASLRGLIELHKQDKENASDEKLAQKRDAHVEVIA